MTPSARALQVRDLRLRYVGRERWAPDGASFGVAAGEVVLVLGPSGCGKSSLALATNGLVPQRIESEVEGEVLASGLDSASTPVGTLAEHVAMVFQDPDAQVITATVHDEVCFGPENLCLPADEVLARAESALRAVGMWERRDDDPAVLSGGGRQRVAIAGALAMDTELIVLDEPTANLDPAGIEAVYDALVSVRAAARASAQRPRAVLLIEHNLEPALALVDRVVVLDATGRTAMAGGVREVLVERAEEVEALGVWLPAATATALDLRRRGVPIDPLPLLPDELATQLQDLPVPTPAPVLSGAAERVPGGEEVVRVRGVAVGHGSRRRRRTVVAEVDFTATRGSFTAIVGANGAGKTTLLQAIAGITAPQQGVVEIDGGVGYVFQNPEHQFVTGTVADELAYGLDPDDDLTRRVEDMLTRFDLTGLRDVHPFLLSGGQKRRLSVGTALIRRPEVLALDEPTYGQDRARALEVLHLLQALRERGRTVLAVTHDLELVAQHASHAVVLGEGRMLAHGPVDDLLADTDLLQRAGLRPPPLARVRAILRTAALREEA